MLATAIIQAALTAAITLVGGCVLFLFSQFIIEGIIKPYINYRKVLAEITHTFVYHANIIVSAPAGSLPDQHAEISAKLRAHSAELRSAITALPFHRLLLLLRLIPRQHRILDAAGRMIRISNRLLETKQKPHDEIFQDMAAIGSALEIDTARL
jgi:hypothetical protein